MSNQAMTQQIIEYFKTQPVVKVWLFGSFARGDENEMSDVDLLIQFDHVTEGRFFCYILAPADNRKTDSCQSLDLSDACSEVSYLFDNILLPFFR